jgi:predicted permease
MRRALGASRWRIARLWLAEGVLIALASLAVGLTTAYWVAEALRAVAPSSLPRLDQLALSGPAIGLCAAGAAAVALTYALVPLIWTGGFAHGARRDLLAHANSRLVNSGRHGRAVLLAGQAGLAAILLTYAVLFSSALERLHSEPLGFDPAGVLTVRLSPPYAGHRDPWPDAAEYGRQLEERLRQQPGVLQAAVATAIPLDEGIDPIGDPQDSGFFVVRGDPTETVWSAIWHSASAGYLETVGLTLTAGRWFDDSDAFTPAELSLRTRREFVAVVTESMARTLWPDGSAVGQRLVGVFGGGHRVVGVIRDLKFRGADEPADFRILVPWSELPHVTPAVLVKTSGDPRDLAAMVSTIARDLRPGTGVQPARTLEELYRASTADTRFATTLVGGFSALAVLLTGVGVFGLVGYAVAARRRELAVRLALGASRRGLAVTIGGSGLRPVLVGTVLGLLAAAGGVRFLRGLLFEVDPLAPGYYLLAGGLLLLVGGAASTAPLRRLLAIDPAETLRSE